jgi:hypothetical protein
MSQEGREIAHALSWLVVYTFGVIISLIIVYEILYYLTTGILYTFVATTSLVGSTTDTAVNFVGLMTVFEVLAVFFVMTFIVSFIYCYVENKDKLRSNEF